MGKLRISAVAKYDDKYICFAKDISLLFEFDSVGNTKGLCLLPEREVDRRCEKLLRWNNKIILVPSSEERIYIYDYVSDELDYIDIPKERKKISCKFFNGFINEDNLYLIGAFYPGILKVDLLSKNLTDIPVYNSLLDCQKEYKDCFTRKSILKVDNKLFIPSAISNQIMCFDMNTDEFRWNRIGEEKYRYSGIECVDGNYWLSPRYNTKLLIFNERGILEEIDLSGYCSQGYNFSGIVLNEDTVVLYSLLLGYSLEINKKNKSIKKIKTGIDVLLEKVDNEIISQIEGGNVTVYLSGNRKDIELNMFGLTKIVDGDTDSNNLHVENEMFGLSDFIKTIYEGGE